MAWERLEAMDWLYRSGPDKGKRRLAGLDSGAASSLFLSLERAGCVVEIYHEDVVDYEATAVVLTVPAAAASSAWKNRAGQRRRARDGNRPRHLSRALAPIATAAPR